MPAPEGNQFWRLREHHGRSLEYKTPEEIWFSISEYLQWCDDNPWFKNEAIKSGEKVGDIVKVPTARPYTLTGMCIHLGISLVTWKEYCKREDFTYITTRTEEIIYTQKFEGAAVGAFNANIIARDLGLSDKSEFTGKDGANLFPTPVTKLPDGTILEI